MLELCMCIIVLYFMQVLAKSSPLPAPTDSVPSRLPVSPTGLAPNDDTISVGDTVSVASSSSVAIPVASPSSATGATSESREFFLPNTWRPSVMQAIEAPNDSERRKRLTPDIRNAIVRDLVSTMYAFKSQPNKDFCTQAAKQLVQKYTFMKDVGTNVSGYVSIACL